VNNKIMTISSFSQLLYEVELDHSPAERVHTETWLAQEMVRCYKLDLLCWYIVYGMTRAGKINLRHNVVGYCS